MASQLPVISGREAARIFGKFGWTFDRQRGSHMILTKLGEYESLSVPNHKELGRGLLRSLIRDANITVQEFADAAK